MHIYSQRHIPWSVGFRAAAATAALGLALAAGPAPRAGAQDKPAPIQEKVTVALKLVQAYVTAKDGKPVTDLTAADFQVTDKPSPIPAARARPARPPSNSSTRRSGPATRSGSCRTRPRAV
ncbi:MAG: hypothetical protein MUE80_08020 [Acidobacteria bacterium]|nr:hypothetical protein [Acidobacteriota bacterium]